MIRVFVADDHAIVCEGLRAWVETVEGLAWAGSVADGDGLLTAVAVSTWDVLVLDLSLPGRSGVDLLRAVRTARPALRVVIYSMFPASDYGGWALAAGASAYVSKSEPLVVLKNALFDIRTVQPAAHDGAMLPHERLSTRERDVFLLLARGSSPSAIAWDLKMAPSTVSTHLKAIREKLGVRSTMEIAQYATRHGLLTNPEG